MKVALVAVLLTIGWSAAIEDVGDQIIQICDLQLVTALQRICEYKDYDYVIQNSQYDPSHHHHDHKHQNHHSAKSDDDLSILERCCYKPCLVKEFKSFCGDM